MKSKPKTYRVTKAYQSPYPKSIIFQEGDWVDIGKEYTDDPDWENWVWCKGKHEQAWAPKQYLKISNGKGRFIKNYNALELCVYEGEELIVYEVINGFCLAEKENGKKGWVPMKNLVQEKEMIEDWDTAYQQRPYVEKNPHDGVVRLIENLDHPTTHQILDLGCGDGRHLVFLAQQGYAPIGIDLAFWGVRRSKQWVDKRRFETKLVCGHARYLPLESESIDTVISIQVIHHQYFKGIQRTISEVQRILRKNGKFYFTVPKYPPSNWKNMRYKQVEGQTYMPLEGFEKNIPHYFFKEEELHAMLEGFEILEMEDDKSRHLAALVKKKSGM